MADFGTTFERLELKYLITEVEAAAIREWVARWCAPDRHNRKDGPGGYVIENIYLDSPDNQTWRAWQRSDTDRFKLRLRTYGKAAPIFAEVKRKTARFIQKIRCEIDAEARRIAGSGFGRAKDPSKQPIFDQFAYFATRIGAEPRLLVRYEREAWASTVDHYARVTFDRRVEAQRTSHYSFRPPDPDGWVPADQAFRLDGLQSPLVLELKCERALPFWMVELIQRFELDLRGYSKYCYGMEATELEDHFGFDPRTVSGGTYV